MNNKGKVEDLLALVIILYVYIAMAIIALIRRFLEKLWKLLK
jgi:hypothetical protein